MAGDLGFAEAGATEFADLIGVEGGGEGAAEAFAVLPGMVESGADPFAEDLAFELGEDGEQRGHGATSRRSQIERLGQ